MVEYLYNIINSVSHHINTINVTFSHIWVSVQNVESNMKIKSEFSLSDVTIQEITNPNILQTY